MPQYALTAHLRTEEGVIKMYEQLHSAVWPEVVADNRRAGVERLHIYRDFHRLTMVVDADDSFVLDNWGGFLTSDATLRWTSLTDPLLTPTPLAVLGKAWSQLHLICQIDTKATGL